MFNKFKFDRLIVCLICSNLIQIQLFYITNRDDQVFFCLVEFLKFLIVQDISNSFQLQLVGTHSLYMLFGFFRSINGCNLNSPKNNTIFGEFETENS